MNLEFILTYQAVTLKTIGEIKIVILKNTSKMLRKTLLHEY